jgi:hypothetical protein
LECFGESFPIEWLAVLSWDDISVDHHNRFNTYLLRGLDGWHGSIGYNYRLFVNAISYLAKTGIAWVVLSTCFGKSNSLWQRFNR